MDEDFHKSPKRRQARARALPDATVTKPGGERAPRSKKEKKKKLTPKKFKEVVPGLEPGIRETF